jgi:hypothetical protein
VCLFTTGWLGKIPAAAAETPPAPWVKIVEAEAMTLQGDWKVVKGQEGYFPAAPNNWSANRIRGGESANPAVATQDVEVPADGKYAVWVRYESPCGFDVHFSLTIQQGDPAAAVYAESFGDRADAKCFNGSWRVQGPWNYHNTDYVYQKGVANLKRGQARLTLTKSSAGKYTAARIVDLIALTDDLNLEPGRELNAWQERGPVASFYHPGIMVHCNRPFYFRLQIKPGAAASRATLTYRHGTGWRGPRRSLAFTTDRSLFERYETENATLETTVARKRAAFPENERLPGGYDSGWMRYELNTFDTATVIANCAAEATLQVARNADGADAAAFNLQSNVPLSVLVATGDSRMEDELFRGRVAATGELFAEEFTAQLAAYSVSGQRPYLFGNLVTPSTSFGKARWPFFEAVGGSGVYFQVPPDAYLPENAKRLGVNRSMAYRALQNMGLKFKYYEGDYADLRKALEAIRAGLDAEGVGDIPQTFKMIEESGPPSLALLRASPVISEKFRDYLKGLGAKPGEFVARAALAAAVAAGKTADADLWPLVMLSPGAPQDAADNPALFYHSKQFGNLLFADNCAMAVKFVEEIFPKGSRANAGAIFPQDGHGVRRNWYDEFTLFRRRGMTSFGSEMTWGLNGTPYYAGAQSESYEGTIARGVAKYHDATLGPTHLLACKRYGYPAEYVELTTYALASHGYRAVHYYINADFTGLDHYKAMKRAGFALGAVEKQMIGSKVVPGKVALGWSETTAIWDQAVPTDSGFNRPGNLMYGLERHYLYLLLRHLQLPVDLLSDADVEEGRLKGYAAYFMVGDHTTARAAQAVRDWVADGGVLVSGAGGGLWDEYNRPLDTLKDVYGIKGARQYAAEQGRAYIPGEDYAVNVNDNRLEKQEQALRAKLELLHALPLDTITCNGRELPVLGYKQGLTAEGGGVAGTFAGGGAAIITNSFGKGQALIMGFLPGISYLYQAFPLRPYGRGGEDLSVYLYPDYKPLVREALAGLIRGVWPAMGAAVTASNPYVEANLMADAAGNHYVALVNFSGAPIDALELLIRKAEAGQPATVSAQFSKPRVEDAGERLRVTLPLNRFDFITLNK